MTRGFTSRSRCEVILTTHETYSDSSRIVELFLI